MDRFVTRLKNLATTCEFGNLKDELIRDHIVVIITNDSTRERLLQEPNLTLDGAIQIAKTAEVTKDHLKQLQEETAEVAAVNHKKFSRKQKSSGPQHKQVPQQKQNPIKEKHSSKQCKRCGTEHGYGKCLAYGKQCRQCRGMNQ